MKINYTSSLCVGRQMVLQVRTAVANLRAGEHIYAFVCKLLDMRTQSFLFIHRAGGQGGQDSIALPLPFIANRHTYGGKSFVLL